MTENEAREGGPGSERTPAGRNGSFRRPEGSGRNDSREGQRDARTSRSRDASESPRSSPEDRSAARPASGGTSPLGSAIGSLFHVLAWMFLAAVCAMIAYLIYRAISEFERAEKPQLAPEGDAGPVDLDTDSAPGEIPADVYVARARQFAQAGQFRDAVSQLLLGAMSHIERAGLIRYRRGLTLRDYLRAVRRAKPQFTGMKSMVRIYEPLGFGRRDATREHFESSLAGYEQGFKVG